MKKMHLDKCKQRLNMEHMMYMKKKIYIDKCNKELYTEYMEYLYKNNNWLDIESEYKKEYKIINKDIKRWFKCKRIHDKKYVKMGGMVEKFVRFGYEKIYGYKKL